MNILKYADVINKQLIITYYPNQNKRFSASFEFCEVKKLPFLRGVYGNGKTPEAAIKDYCTQISNKTLVFDAMSTKRQEFNCLDVGY